MIFREKVTFMKQFLYLWIGFIEVIRDNEFSLGTTEDSGLRLMNCDQLRHRLSSLSDDDLFSQSDSRQELGKIGLSLVDVDFHTLNNGLSP